MVGDDPEPAAKAGALFRARAAVYRH